MVDVFDVTGLHGEPIHDDGEVGYLPAVLLKSLRALDGVGIFVGVKAGLEIFDGGSAAGSNRFKVSTVFGLLRLESFRKSTIPSCFGCRQGVVDVTLNIVSLFSEGGDKVFVPIFTVDNVLQLVDSRASDVLGQGSNGFGGELISPVVNEGEGAFRVDDGGFGHLQDFGGHLEVNLGSKHFAVFERVIGRG